MNLRTIGNAIGKLCLLTAMAMAFPLTIALGFRSSDVHGFLVAALVALLVGLGLSFIKPGNDFGRKEGYAVVGLGWIVVTALGALPLYFSRALPTYTDAFFEIMSGFTTTGATVFRDIEAAQPGVVFWRGLTHWIGGMGIIVLSLAIFSFSRQGGALFQTEVPGPVPERILPRIKKTATVLWIIYAALTLAQTIALKVAGMPLFESVVHSFGTMATGGYSTRNISIEAYHSVPIELIILIFMMVAGMNFSLFYRVIQRRSLKALFSDPETKGYLAIILTGTVLSTISLAASMKLPLLESLRRSAFQVVSIITTTGFSSDNFDLWPSFSRAILLILMFIGGSTGSTAGAIKVARVILLFKYAKRQIMQAVNPKLILQTKLGSVAIPDSVIHKILAFFFMYICFFAVGALVVMATGQDMITSISASASALGNVGPGLRAVGPLANYAGLHVIAKWTLSFLMLAGRLEILTIVVLLSPKFWRSSSM